MLDLKRITREPELIQKVVDLKGGTCDVESILELDNRRKMLIKEAEISKAGPWVLVSTCASSAGIIKNWLPSAPLCLRMPPNTLSSSVISSASRSARIGFLFSSKSTSS